MDKNPFFSVVIATYNRAYWVSKAIGSVLNQTYSNWELIIVDDGSTDNTSEVVESFKDPRIQYIYQKNQERSAARNNGMDQSTGEYITFLDSDDYYLENHLATFHQRIIAAGSPIAVFFANTYEERDGELAKIPPPQLEVNKRVEFVLVNTIGVPRACLHRDIFNEFQFNPEFTMAEDTELWVRVLKKYPYYYHNDYTQVYLEHTGRSNDWESALTFQKILEARKKILDHVGVQDASKKVRRSFLAFAYLKLAYHYYYAGVKGKFFSNILPAIFIDPGNRLKEKIYLALTVFFKSQKA